jgi:hypothetical protein
MKISNSCCLRVNIAKPPRNKLATAFYVGSRPCVKRECQEWLQPECVQTDHLDLVTFCQRRGVRRAQDQRIRPRQ